MWLSGSRWAYIFYMGVGVTVFVGMWALIVLAVNGEAMEGCNTTNDCALNQSQKWCFTTFYLYTFASIMLNCPCVCVYVYMHTRACMCACMCGI